MRPGLEPFRVPQLGQVAPDAKQRHLRGVLGQRSISKDAVSDSEEPVEHLVRDLRESAERIRTVQLVAQEELFFLRELARDVRIDLWIHAGWKIFAHGRVTLAEVELCEIHARVAVELDVDFRARARPAGIGPRCRGDLAHAFDLLGR